MAEQKRQDFQIPTGRSVDAGGERGFTMLLGEREPPAMQENSGGVAIGCFPDWVLGSRQKIRKATKLRADLEVLSFE